MSHPDLWWPYTLGAPDLYDLNLEFRQYDRVVDAAHQRFGIRTVQQFRDDDEHVSRNWAAAAAST